MAPGRRRGARGVGTKRELSLGDLVLAKVKGFPAWPAKISRPEDWKKSPDPRKHFVVFFGTSEIAFVAPTDIQEFTHEVKLKLSDRGKGKTGKQFDQALKQICEEFEKLQPKNLRTGRDANCSQTLASDADSLDQVVNDDTVVTEKDGTEMQESSSSEETTRTSASEYFSQKQGKVSEDSHGKEVDESSDDQDELQNGHKSMMANEKTKGAVNRNRSSVIMFSGKVYAKRAPSCSLKGTSPDVLKSGIVASNDRNDNRLLVDDLRGAANDERKRVMTRRKMKAKASKSDDIEDRDSRARASNTVNNKLTSIESKRTAAVNSGVEKSAHESKDSIYEDSLPLVKRHHRANEEMPSAVENSDVKSMMSPSSKINLVHPVKIQSPVRQLPKKRRAVRLCDTDDDELPKTPVHGGFASKSIPQVSDPIKKKVRRDENSPHSHLVSRKSGPMSFGRREHARSSDVIDHRISAAGQRASEKTRKESSGAFPKKEMLDAVLHLENGSSLDEKIVDSTKGSPLPVTMETEEVKIKHSDVAHVNSSQKRTPGITDRGHTTTHKPTSFASQSHIEVNRKAPLSNHIISRSERIDAAKDVKTSYMSVSKISDSVMSMKHLIAAAQERKKQARTLKSYGYPLLFIPDTEMPECSPIPSPATQALDSGYMTQMNIQWPLPNFPESDAHQDSYTNQTGNEDVDNNGVNSENQFTGITLSGNTEASVARDAFEGMIETLSRTKESIGRATRHAIDCAKYGIANEVVELLIRKLENEQSLHRKVDLFFLVDSITQCSHSQRGIAEASYIPVVKAVLPRLVGAVAPSCAGAKENRRQCLKVLRLWLERKILPESVLRSCINDLGQARDDASIRISLRRPSRSERAIDDPIREMEGIVVDEYGSNATFHLPGLLSGHAFDEEEYEETLPAILGTEIEDAPKDSPATSEGHGNHDFAPSERFHCILEDVDGELEMEDVSGNHKDEKIYSADTSMHVPVEPCLKDILRTAPSISTDSESSPESPPPLPTGSPPPSPPLPTSPPTNLSLPPSLPPPPSSSPPCLPSFPPLPAVGEQNSLPLGAAVPPPIHPIAPPFPPVAPLATRPTPSLVNPPPPTGAPPMIPVAPPPLPPFEPPPWPPLGPNALQPIPFCHPPQGPPLSVTGPPQPVVPPMSAAGHPQSAASHMQVISQPSFAAHPSIHSQHVPQIPPAISHAPRLPYQPPRVPHEIIGFPSVNQPTHDASIRGDVLAQPSSCFVSTGISAPVEPVGYPSRPHGDAYMNPQLPQQWNHFHPARAPGHFSYLNTPHQSQQPRHSIMQIPDGPMRYAGDDKRWTQTKSNADCPNSGWIPGPRPHSGYFGSTFERPPANSIPFHHPVSHTLPSSSQVPVHGGPMLPYRADSSSVNWRPS